MNKILILYLVLIFVLSGCNSSDGSLQTDKDVEIIAEQSNEINQLVDKIAHLNEVIQDSNNKIAELEELNNTNNIIKKINSIFHEDEFQDIVGIKKCDKTILMVTPYEDSISLGEIISGEVKVIATGKNEFSEEWALVEVLNRIVDGRYGYVKLEFLMDGVTGKFDYDNLNVDISLDSITIGDSMDAVIHQFGDDYYKIKDSNAYQIGYELDDSGGHIVFTIDSKVLKVMGIRIVSSDYKLDNGIGVDIPLSTIYDIYSGQDIKNIEGQYVVDIGDGFIMMIQVYDEQENEETISRIDIEPDWNGVF